jgi:hypothetical protein
VTTRGVLFIHAATSALCPHVEWAVAGVLGVSVPMQWTPQPVAPGTFRTEVSWRGPVGTAAAITTALRGWQHLRFEVTEEPTAASEGARYCFTPALGVFHAVTGLHGDILVREDRLRAAMSKAAADGVDLAAELDTLLGKAWDAELEPFRHAGDGTPVRWLHEVG